MMTDTLMQDAFEAHLGDLERLIALRMKGFLPDTSPFDDILWAKINTLAKHSVHVSESRTIKDIERLLPLRNTMQTNGICLDMMTLFGLEPRIDRIIKHKVKNLVDSDNEKLDLEAIESLDRLTRIKSVLSNTAGGSYDPYLRNMSLSVIEWKVEFLAHCMQPAENFMDHKPLIENGTALPSPSNTNAPTKHVSQEEHSDATLILDRRISDLKKQVHEPQAESASEAAEAIRVSRHKDELIEELNKTIVELKDEKILLKAQLQTANATLGQVKKALRPLSPRLDTGSSEVSTVTTSEGELTPTSSSTSYA